MQTTQRAVPIDAARRASQGDARALLSIPDARADILRLIAGEKAPRRHRSRAGDFGNRKAIAAAKVVMIERKARREARLEADQARTGKPGKWSHEAALRSTPGAIARRLHEGLEAGKYTAGRVRRELKKCPAAIAELPVETVVSLIGAIGDQAEADLREFRTGVGHDRYKPGRYHYFAATNLHSVQILPDWTAALVTMRDFVSFGRGDAGNHGHDSTRGVSFRCYLVVRDTTTKQAHVLRVPPKFGNNGTRFYGTFTTPGERIKAAVAWTFGMESREYAPAVEA